MKIWLTAALMFYYLLLTLFVQSEKAKERESVSLAKGNASDVTVRRNHTTRLRNTSPRKKKTQMSKNKIVFERTKTDFSCTSLGGICQPQRYICQGRYLNDKCSRGNTQCCLPDGAWSVLCSGHHNNRVRACDGYGCGAFNSRRGDKLHKAVDLVCDDYGVINAPFSGVLSGPVSLSDPSGIQYDGVKLVSSGRCVELLNMRPYVYMGSVTRGGAVGYLLPLQDRFSGITSHLRLQMCDGSDPTPFI